MKILGWIRSSALRTRSPIDDDDDDDVLLVLLPSGLP